MSSTALILGHLIVVAMLPSGVCTTDSDCERASYDFGCLSYSPDLNPSPDWQDDALGDALFICDRATFERKIHQITIEDPFPTHPEWFVSGPCATDADDECDDYKKPE